MLKVEPTGQPRHRRGEHIVSPPSRRYFVADVGLYRQKTIHSVTESMTTFRRGDVPRGKLRCVRNARITSYGHRSTGVYKCHSVRTTFTT